MKKYILPVLLICITMQLNAQVFYGPENPVSKFGIAKPEYFDATDLDSDGDLDALIVSRGTQSLVWAENLNGNGYFGEVHLLADGLEQPSNSIGVDVDNDGDMDIVSAVWGTDELFWLENLNGLGQFSDKQIIDHHASGIWRVRSADLDGDGDQDLVSAEREGGAILWYENLDGQGEFSTGNTIDDQMANARDAYPADLDNDGDLDIVTVDWFDKEINWHRNEEGTFSGRMLISDRVDDIDIVYCNDFNGDGLIDVLARDRVDLFWIPNLDGGENFGQEQLISGGETIHDYYPSDFDGDGDMDILAIAGYYSYSGWYVNNGSGAFAAFEAIPNSLPGADFIQDADIDGDGDPDCVALDWDKSLVYYHENTDGLGDTQIARIIANADIPGPSAMELADINGDGNQEILVSSRYNSKIYYYERLEREGAFGPVMDIQGFVLDPSAVSTGDLDGDGNTDILSASFYDGSLFWFQNVDNNHFSLPILIGKFQSTATDILSADLDGDGDEDVVGSSLYDGQLAVFENNGSAEFNNMHILSDELSGAYELLVTDLDMDGDPDLAVVSKFDDKLSWFENLGSLNFSAEKLIDTDLNSTQCLTAGDFDNDGDTDLAATAYNLLRWYENTDGRAEFIVHEIETGEYLSDVFDLSAADVDNDGDLDIFLASEDLDHVVWLKNENNGSEFIPQIVVGQGLSEPRALGFEDVDGDGRQDVVITSHEDNKIGWYKSEEIPVFLRQPINDTICSEGQVQFSVEVDKADAYQWYISPVSSGGYFLIGNNDNFSGVESSELTVTITPEGNWNQTEYRCRIYYMGVAFESESALLTVDRLIEADAGSDFETCNDWANLYGNQPNQGSGNWSLVEGYGEFDDVGDPFTQIRNLQQGNNVLRWTIQNGTCLSADEVDILKYDSVRVELPFEYVQYGVGVQAEISLSVTGDVLSYQWYKDGTVLSDDDRISGSNTASLIIDGTDAAEDSGLYHCVVTGECNTVYSGQIEVLVDPVNTDEWVDESLKVYPNPVKDVLRIESRGNILSYDIRNVQGAAVLSADELQQSSLLIDMENLPEGSYFLKVSTDRGYRTVHILK